MPAGDGYGASQHPIANKKKAPPPKLPGYGASQHPVAPSGNMPSVLDTYKSNSASTPGSSPYRPVSTTPYSTPAGPSIPGGTPSTGSDGRSTGTNPSTGPSALDKLYSDLKASLMQTGVDNNALIDKSVQAIKGNYSDATLDTYRAYMNSRDELSGRATNLGVDLDTSKMGQTWDGSMRRLNEMADSNMDSDLSYMEKMRQIKQSALDAILTGIEQDKLSKAAAMMGGGGGSYRGGGGSSGSGSATETQTVNNVGDYETYQALLKTNPSAAQQYYNHYWSSGANPINATASLLKELADKNRATSFWNPVAKVIRKATYTPAVSAMQGLAGVWGNPKIGQKTTYKGK